MTPIELIHWHEGLFLHPHHLQRLQRGMLHAIAGERHLAWAYPYGVIEAELSADALENFLVSFTRLRAVLPSGVVVDMPRGANLPALNIKQAFEGTREPLTVFLGVPTWSDSAANTIEEGPQADPRVKRVYQVVEQECRDENTGENPQPVLMRRINARLVLADDDVSDLEVLPLLRIVPAAGETGTSLPGLDRSYIPPCMVLGGNEALKGMIWDIANQASASRQELVVDINRSGYNVETLAGVQLERVLRLRTLNGYAARLQSLVDLPTVSPFAVYLELRGMLGELAALQPGRDLFDAPPYAHEDCRPVFVELINRIRNLMLAEGAGTYAKIPFEPEGEQLVAQLTDEHILKAEDYFLGVQTRQDAHAVAGLIEDGDRFKLIASTMMGSRIRGVRLREERYPPQILPSAANLLWFRLVRSESPRMWAQVRDERKLAAVWPRDSFGDIDIALYVIFSEAGDAG